MLRSRALWVPISIGVLAILFTIAVLVAWNIIFTSYYVLATKVKGMPTLNVGYWLALSMGSLFLVMVVIALLLFLIANVRQALYVTQQKTFIDSVTHELKSPLASLYLSLETLEQRKLSPEMQSRFVSMMKKDIDRLREFIDHVLVAGRLDDEHHTLHFERTDVSRVLDECVSRIRHRHGLSVDAIEVQTPPKATEASVDRIALETVVLNLLDNAVKYSAEKVHVHVQLEERDSAFMLRVRDEGVGIARRELRRVFRRFYRVDRRGRPSPKGTGLGLYVVHSLVRRLGGKVWVESAGEGRGSTFFVEFPRRMNESSESDEPAVEGKA